MSKFTYWQRVNMSKLYNKQYFTRTSSRPLKNKVIESTIKEIIRLAKTVLKSEPNTWTVLDVGSGVGDYSKVMAKYVKEVVGIEPYPKAFNLAKQKSTGNNIKLYNCSIEEYYSDQRFDLAISLTTLEHMPKAEESFARIFELLKPGGILYMTAPNKLWPLEPHYGLLFLNWLPIKLANMYLQLARGVASFENSAYARTYFGLKRLLGKYNCEYTFVVPNQNSEFIGCGEKRSNAYNLLKNLGIWLINKSSIFWVFSKGFIVVAVKIR